MARKELEDISTEELEDFFIDNIVKTKDTDKKIYETKLLFEPFYSDTYMSLGAFDIIRDRKGEDYALSLLGRRKPKTIREHVKSFVTGSYPRL